jgi:simple sugar transport system permease protein
MPGTSGHQFPWLVALLVATLYSATPLVLAALAGVLSERAGVVNIALEGLLLTGAFFGVCAGQGSPLAGVFAAVMAGALLGLLHAILTQKTKMNHVVSGLGITLLAAGSTRFLFQRVFPSSGISITGVSRDLFLYAAIVLPILITVLLYRTRFGLRLRAVGENPESARMAGISPLPSRIAAVTLSGALGGFAGAYLSMAEAHQFSPGMSAGKGYIALAAVIFGKWSPVGATLGALFFGFFDALQNQLQISGVQLKWLGIEWTSPFLLHSLPYLMTIIALVSVVGRATPPAALGVSEESAA